MHFALALVLAGATAGASHAQVRTYDVVTTTMPPTIDGVRGVGEWDEAEPATGEFRLLRTPDPGDLSSEQISWQALWDQDAFYLIMESDYGSWSPASENPIDFGEDNTSFYLDPNVDGEPNPTSTPDGYQFAMNQRVGSSGFSAGVPFGTGFFFEAHIDSLFGNQGGWAGFRDSTLMQENGASGGVLEMRIPWTEFDADPNGVSGLRHTEAPNPGEVWFFNIGRISTDAGNLLPVWNYTTSQVFAERPHGEITFLPPPSACPFQPAPGCISADKPKLTIREKKPGREKLSLALKKLAVSSQQSDFGDPVSGTTVVAACLYDAADLLLGTLEVDRAGLACGNRACWRAVGTRGFKYKDPELAAAGVRSISLVSGAAGKGGLALKARNQQPKGRTELPTGLTTALEGQARATVQVQVSDGGCFEGVLDDVRKADGLEFKAR